MCYFVVDLAERVSVQFLKIFFAGRHKDAGHIEGAGTDYQLCVAFGSVALRTMGCARNVDGDKSVARVVPGKEVVAWLGFSFVQGQAVQVAVNQPYTSGQSSLGNEGPYRTEVSFDVVGDAGFAVGEGFETFFYRCAHQFLPLADEGYIFLAYGLEMEVVGGRSTAFGSVVEYGVAAGEVLLQPVDQAFGQPARSFVGQCLPLVTFRGDGEVSRQNGVWIQSQAERFVQLDADRLLLFRLVAQTKEAGTGSDGGLVYFGTGGNGACRIELHGDVVRTE